MPFTPIKSRKTFEEAVDQIAEAIRSGALVVGDKLPSERVLAEQMEISRPTLREAIRVLSGAGVLTVQHGRDGGTFVRTEVVPIEFLRAQSYMLTTEVAAVLEARRLLEPAVAQLAGRCATEEDFEVMRGVIELQRRYMQEPQRRQFLQLDLRFHLAIAQATRNKTIVSVMKVLFRQLEIAWDMAIRGPHDPRQMIQIHEETLRAIMSRDPDRIAAAMDEHLSWLERFWQEENGRTPLRTR
jgi:GntR family transcriptional repressor for pyruvate dehydrogenase complex